MKTSKKARDWEAGRKKALAKDKPLWVKEQRRKKIEEENRAFTKLLKGGHYMSKLNPAPGYVLIKPEEKDSEKVTDSGIIIPSAVDQHEPNSGVVVGVGVDRVHPGGVIEQAPCKPGDKVLHKYGTLELTLWGEKHFLMGFGDVLGVLTEEPKKKKKTKK
jgi:co-chaperonin GroES (HSP10)